MITTLPKYVSLDLSSVRENRLESLIRDEFETGPAQQRRVDCVPKYELRVKFQICKSKREEFDCWFEDVLCNGSQWFKMDHPVTGKTYKFRFVGNNLQWTFIPYSIWEAQVTLERWGK